MSAPTCWLPAGDGLHATAFGYDDAGRLLSVTEASCAMTSYTYDKNCNKLAQKDANGHVWSFTYDALDRLSQEKDPLNRTMSFTYDPLGNLHTKTDGKGQTTTYAYNVRRLTATTYADGATESLTYDSLGRRIGMSNASVSFAYVYDTLNRVTKVTNQTYNQVVNYTYDASGNLATRSLVSQGLTRWFPAGTATTGYAYDPKNRLTTINDPLAGIFRLTYDPMDRRTSLTYPNGTATFYTYDKAYRLSAMATKGSAGNVLDGWSYQYDASGNRTSKTDMDGKVEGYSYDNVYRLSEARYGDGTRETFTYDPAGNRLKRTDESGTTVNSSYDVANQLLTSGSDTLTYDGNGNMVTKSGPSGSTTMAYDAASRVTAVVAPNGTETNVWSPDGRRMQIVAPTLNFETGSGGASLPLRPIYDLAGNPIADADSGSGILRYRVYGPGIDEPLAETLPGAEMSYLHHDALGSITCATDPTGLLLYRNRYKAFGQNTFTAYTGDANYYTRLSYTSRESSVGGLYQYRSRYYDDGVGRFAQQDRYRGDASVVPSLHRFAYANSDPVRFRDPSGKFVAPQAPSNTAIFTEDELFDLLAEAGTAAAEVGETGAVATATDPSGASRAVFGGLAFVLAVAIVWLYFFLVDLVMMDSDGGNPDDDPLAEVIQFPEGVWQDEPPEASQGNKDTFCDLIRRPTVVNVPISTWFSTKPAKPCYYRCIGRDGVERVFVHYVSTGGDCPKSIKYHSGLRPYNPL